MFGNDSLDNLKSGVILTLRREIFVAWATYSYQVKRRLLAKILIGKVMDILNGAGSASFADAIS